MTVSRAVQQLVEQGWLERRRGQPTRVAQRQANDTNNSSQLLLAPVDALIKQAQQLGMDLDELQHLLGERWQQ